VRSRAELRGVAFGGFASGTDTLAARGLGYEHLDRLAPEHLYGVR